jgi:hypothetical protein
MQMQTMFAMAIALGIVSMVGVIFFAGLAMVLASDPVVRLLGVVSLSACVYAVCFTVTGLKKEPVAPADTGDGATTGSVDAPAIPVASRESAPGEERYLRDKVVQFAEGRWRQAGRG